MNDHFERAPVGSQDPRIAALLDQLGIAPRPGVGESITDANIHRRQSHQRLGIIKNIMSKSLLGQQLGGMDPNSIIAHMGPVDALAKGYQQLDNNLERNTRDKWGKKILPDKQAGLFDTRPLRAAGKFLMNKVVRPAAGRVVTNTVVPFGYGGDKLEHLRKNSVKDIIKAVWNDKPLYPIDNYVKDRNSVYRAGFGLKPQSFDSGALKATGSNTFEFNPATQAGRSQMKAVVHDPKPTGHDIMGGYTKDFNPATGDLKYYDKWDFDMHPGTKLQPGNVKEMLQRWGMGKVYDAPEIKGTIGANSMPSRSLNAVGKMSDDAGTMYTRPAEGGLPSLYLQPQARLEKLQARLGKSSDRYLDAMTRPGAAPENMAALRSSYNSREALQQKLKETFAARQAHYAAPGNVRFYPDGRPPVQQSQTLLGAVEGTQYDKYAPYLRAADRVGQGLDYADRAVLPAGLLMGGMGLDDWYNERRRQQQHVPRPVA